MSRFFSLALMLLASSRWLPAQSAPPATSPPCDLQANVFSTDELDARLSGSNFSDRKAMQDSLKPIWYRTHGENSDPGLEWIVVWAVGLILATGPGFLLHLLLRGKQTTRWEVPKGAGRFAKAAWESLSRKLKKFSASNFDLGSHLPVIRGLAGFVLDLLLMAAFFLAGWILIRRPDGGWPWPIIICVSAVSIGLALHSRWVWGFLSARKWMPTYMARFPSSPARGVPMAVTCLLFAVAVFCQLATFQRVSRRDNGADESASRSADKLERWHWGPALPIPASGSAPLNDSRPACGDPQSAVQYLTRLSGVKIDDLDERVNGIQPGTLAEVWTTPVWELLALALAYLGTLTWLMIIVSIALWETKDSPRLPVGCGMRAAACCYVAGCTGFGVLYFSLCLVDAVKHNTVIRNYLYARALLVSSQAESGHDVANLTSTATTGTETVLEYIRSQKRNHSAFRRDEPTVPPARGEIGLGFTGTVLFASGDSFICTENCSVDKSGLIKAQNTIFEEKLDRWLKNLGDNPMRLDRLGIEATIAGGADPVGGPRENKDLAKSRGEELRNHIHVAATKKGIHEVVRLVTRLISVEIDVHQPPTPPGFVQLLLPIQRQLWPGQTPPAPTDLGIWQQDSRAAGIQVDVFDPPPEDVTPVVRLSRVEASLTDMLYLAAARFGDITPVNGLARALVTLGEYFRYLLAAMAFSLFMSGERASKE